jgi:hypothetical protein
MFQSVYPIKSNPTMKNFILASAIVCVSVSACHSPKAAATAETTPAPVTTSAPPPSPNTIQSAGSQASHDEVIMSEQDKLTGNFYRLIVSFISIGEGTDRQGRETLDGVLADWKTKKGKEITFESIAWGREGENDFCFRINNLSAKEQELFVADMKSAFKGRSLIQITENQACVHKR